MKTFPSIRIVGRGGKARPAQRGPWTAGLYLVICKVWITCLCQTRIDDPAVVSILAYNGDNCGETIGWKLENERGEYGFGGGKPHCGCC